MKTFLLNTSFFIFLCLFSSCSSFKSNVYNAAIPPCQLGNTGTVCFKNYTPKQVQVQFEDNRLFLQPNSETCVDVQAEKRTYKAKETKGLIRKDWKGKIPVKACETMVVRLTR